MVNHPLKATIDRIEDDKAILHTDDGQSIIWPAENLPADTGEGSVVYINLTKSKIKEKEQENLAKNILNEIMNNGKN